MSSYETKPLGEVSEERYEWAMRRLNQFYRQHKRGMTIRQFKKIKSDIDAEWDLEDLNR